MTRGDEVLLRDCSLRREQWMPEAVRLNTIVRIIPGESLENRNHVIQSSIQSVPLLHLLPFSVSDKFSQATPKHIAAGSTFQLMGIAFNSLGRGVVDVL